MPTWPFLRNNLYVERLLMITPVDLEASIRQLPAEDKRIGFVVGKNYARLTGIVWLNLTHEGQI